MSLPAAEYKTGNYDCVDGIFQTSVWQKDSDVNRRSKSDWRAFEGRGFFSAGTYHQSDQQDCNGTYGKFRRNAVRIGDGRYFAGEEFHPRLIAWLLRMGDLCDLDNDRFNRIGIATFGTLQDENLAHYFKHCSVETLYISIDKIRVIADINKKAIREECASDWMKDDAIDNKEQFQRRWMKVYQQTIREHVNWKNWMESEINAAKLNVNKIFPKHWSRKIPEIEYTILLNGERISSGNENLRFSFSQEKAYSLIENISIYQNEGLIFLRELIQNAIDASKIQIWREIKEKSRRKI